VKSPEKLVPRPKQERPPQLLRGHGTMSPAEIRAGIPISRQGAMDLPHPLLEAGMVEKIGGGKTGKYTLKHIGAMIPVPGATKLRGYASAIYDAASQEIPR